jgi:Flp pilus assembly protein TadG
MKLIMKSRKATPRPLLLREEQGQAIVLMAVSIAVLLVITALVIDGGNAMAHQRATQNGTDASSLAGASVLVQKMGGATRTDADVSQAVTNALAANQTNLISAEYVDYNHNVVGQVGQGGAIPASAAGVRVDGTRSVATYLSNLANIGSISTGATATALAGALDGICAASEGCVMAPVTFSIPITTCDGTNRPLRIGQEWPLVEGGIPAANNGNMSIVPLCFNGPGGVGWLDMGVLGCPGNNMADWILTPCNKSVPLPVWLQTQSGDMNNVENAMNTHQGKIILIPMFDSTCRDVPSSGLPADCTDPGQGNNIWYHIPKFAAFLLYEAYIQGNDEPDCNSLPGQPMGGGNGATSCMKGWFIKYITVGPVGPPQDCDDAECEESLLGVQLVK